MMARVPKALGVVTFRVWGGSQLTAVAPEVQRCKRFAQSIAEAVGQVAMVASVWNTADAKALAGRASKISTSTTSS